MKTLIFGALLLTSFSSFAAGLKDCKALLATYTCTIENQSLEVSVDQVSGNKASISFAGDKGETYTFDGVNRTSLAGDIQIKASCKDKGTLLEVLTTHEGVSEAITLKALTSKTAIFTMGKSGEEMSLNCTKK